MQARSVMLRRRVFIAITAIQATGAKPTLLRIAAEMDDGTSISAIQRVRKEFVTAGAVVLPVQRAGRPSGPLRNIRDPSELARRITLVREAKQTRERLEFPPFLSPAELDAVLPLTHGDPRCS